MVVGDHNAMKGGTAVEKLAYSLNEAGRLLGLSRWTLLRLAQRGQLRIIRVSPRCPRIPRSELLRLAAEGIPTEEEQ